MASSHLTVLDLHSLAVLTVYEATAFEPRFRHAKLLEVTSTPTFSSVAYREDDPAFAAWRTRAEVVRRGYLFESFAGLPVRQPDTPNNMVLTNLEKGMHPSVLGLTDKEKEAIFYQARMHNGCNTLFYIFQHLLDFYKQSQMICIRDASGTSYETAISSRLLMKFDVVQPREMCLSIVLPRSTTYIHGGADRMPHFVFGFSPSLQSDGNIETILDLSSLQFHDAGRDVAGELFWLGNDEKWVKRMCGAAAGVKLVGASRRMTGETAGEASESEKIARKVQERYAAGPSSFCAYCGAPKPPKKCVCAGEYYCDAKHQNSAWAYHKVWCTAKKSV